MDFFILNDEIPVDDRFINEKELNFLNMNSSGFKSKFTSFLSLEKFILSCKNIYFVFNDSMSKSYFNNSGFLYKDKNDIQISNGTYDIETAIKEDSLKYMRNKKYDKLSKIRIGYLKEFLYLASQYGIKIYPFITPINNYQYKKILKDVNMNQTLMNFKKEIAKLFNKYHDFMDDSQMNKNNNNFYDLVHIKQIYADYIINSIFTDKLDIKCVESNLNEVTLQASPKTRLLKTE